MHNPSRHRTDFAVPSLVAAPWKPTPDSNSSGCFFFVTSCFDSNLDYEAMNGFTSLIYLADTLIASKHWFVDKLLGMQMYQIKGK